MRKLARLGALAIGGGLVAFAAVPKLGRKLPGIGTTFADMPNADPAPVEPMGDQAIPPAPRPKPEREPEGRSEDVDYLARTIWGEARGEGHDGMLAVAHVVLNRLADSRWPDTIREVVTQRFQFSAWNENDPNRKLMLAATTANPSFKRAVEIAEAVLEGRTSDPTGGANHYFADWIAQPSWARTMTSLGKLGRHIFKKG